MSQRTTPDGQEAKFEPPGVAYIPPHHGLTGTATAAVAGGWTVIVLPGGATTVVPPAPGVVMTVLGDALGAGTITVPPGCTVV
jgi:hypothetical protein